MTDLIERLRENVAEVPDTYWPGRMKEYAAEAADEIERLRDRIARAMVEDAEQKAEIEQLRVAMLKLDPKDYTSDKQLWEDLGL